MYRKSDPETIQALFASIAQNYDRTNTTLSFGLHKKWNRQLIEAIGAPPRLLDLCAGTGEIAFGFLKKYPTAEAILLDFCPEMLAIALKKGESFQERFEIIQADAQSIPLPHHSVEGVTLSYGIRNIKDPLACFREVHRVLTPGGCFGILENTRPSSRVLRPLHRFYTHQILPLLGKITTKNIDAYKYLAESIATFTSPETLEAYLLQTGFHHIKRRALMGGIATLITAHSIDYTSTAREALSNF